MMVVAAKRASETGIQIRELLQSGLNGSTQNFQRHFLGGLGGSDRYRRKIRPTDW